MLVFRKRDLYSMSEILHWDLYVRSETGIGVRSAKGVPYHVCLIKQPKSIVESIGIEEPCEGPIRTLRKTGFIVCR